MAEGESACKNHGPSRPLGKGGWLAWGGAECRACGRFAQPFFKDRGGGVPVGIHPKGGLG